MMYKMKLMNILMKITRLKDGSQLIVLSLITIKNKLKHRNYIIRLLLLRDIKCLWSNSRNMLNEMILMLLIKKATNFLLELKLMILNYNINYI